MRLFDRLDVDITDATQPIKDMLITDGPLGAEPAWRLHFGGGDYLPKAAHMIESIKLSERVARKLKATRSIHLFTPAKIKNLTHETSGVKGFIDNQEVAARLLIAADARLSVNIVTPLVGVIGLMHGVLNGLALKSGPGSLALLGIAGMLFAIVALVIAFTVSLERPWSRVVVRVMGSWVAASGLLMIGWFFRVQI